MTRLGVLATPACGGDDAPPPDAAIGSTDASAIDASVDAEPDADPDAPAPSDADRA